MSGACGPGPVVGSRPRPASARGVPPAWCGQTRTGHSRQSCHPHPQLPDRVWDRTASTVGAAARPARRCATIGCGRSGRAARSVMANPSTWATAGCCPVSIHVVPDSSSVIWKPLRMARPVSSSPSCTSTRIGWAPCWIAASSVEAHTPSWSMVEGGPKTSACQVSSQAVSPAAATGPFSSNQTGRASWSVARQRRHHHCTSAASHMPPSGSARRARCRTAVVACSRSKPRSMSRRKATISSVLTGTMPPATGSSSRSLFRPVSGTQRPIPPSRLVTGT